MLYFVLFMNIITFHVRYVSSGIACTNVPNFPLHGRLEVSGKFFAVFKCADPETDLPLTAPGLNGILTCDTSDFDNAEMDMPVIPDCLERKIPQDVQMEIRLTYTTMTCDNPMIMVHVTNFIQLRDHYIRNITSICDRVDSCAVTTVRNNCGDNKMFPDSTNPKQLDLKFGLLMNYDRNEDLKAYLKITYDIRRQFFGMDDGFDKAVKLWSISGMELVDLNVGAWVGNCEDHPNTHGTNLALHKVASCRGCPRSWLFEREIQRCVQCSFNYYTTRPFASMCHKCPVEPLWGTDRPEMLKLCYQRI